MNDMTSVIVPKSDQINADDFIAGPQTFTIREVRIRGGEEQPVNILLEGSDKAFRPCKSMSRVLVAAWGPDAKVYVGRSLTLYRDPTVKWGGLEVGGIRISHMSHIEGKMQMQLTATRGQRKPHVVLPLGSKAPTPKPASAAIDDALRTIAACTTQAELRQWWQKNNEAIDDGHYDRILAAFNERLSAVKSEQAASPTVAEGSGEAATQLDDEAVADVQEGRDTADMGENHNDATEEETAERLIREARAKELLGDLTSWERTDEMKDTYDGLSPARQDQVDAAIAEQRQKLSSK